MPRGCLLKNHLRASQGSSNRAKAIVAKPLALRQEDQASAQLRAPVKAVELSCVIAVVPISPELSLPLLATV
ncbi:hypothetical protein Tco_0097770 [Tanacetum coccineum]